MRGAAGRVGAAALGVALAVAGVACDRPEVQAARQARATLVALGLPERPDQGIGAFVRDLEV